VVPVVRPSGFLAALAAYFVGLPDLVILWFALGGLWATL
jgi:hypothetical protein